MDSQSVEKTYDPAQHNAWEIAPDLQDDQDFAVLKRYRDGLYQHLGQKRNAAMDLMDALACQQTAQSVTELSEQAQFPRQYASVTNAIRYAAKEQDTLKSWMETQGVCSTPRLLINDQKYKVLIADTTPDPHPHAHCLKDRSYIHDASNTVTGKPVNIGIQYSALVGVTEDPAWVAPIRFDRVPSQIPPAQFGMQQAISVCSKIEDPCILLFDSAYNNAPCRKIAKKSPTQAIVIVRSACNRHYFLPATPEEQKDKGDQKKYGKRLNLYDPDAGAPADTQMRIIPQDKRGYLRVYYWRTTYTRMNGMKGYEDPSALIVIFEHRADDSLKHPRPMVVRVFVPEPQSFNSGDGSWLYFLRFSVERFLSVQKKRLMLGYFQSPEIERQETFSLMGSMVYQQWYLAKMSGAMQWSIKPWHRYPKANPIGEKLIPNHVQKGFPAVLKKVGTPSVFCPSTNIPPGRQIGQTQAKRTPQPVIRKSKKTNSTTSISKVSSTAESMDGKTKKEATKVAANVIKITIEMMKQAAHWMVFWAILFYFQAGLAGESKSTNSTLFVQNLISSPFEFSTWISNDGVSGGKYGHISTIVLASGKDPPKIDLNSYS